MRRRDGHEGDVLPRPLDLHLPRLQVGDPLQPPARARLPQQGREDPLQGQRGRGPPRGDVPLRGRHRRVRHVPEHEQDGDLPRHALRGAEGGHAPRRHLHDHGRGGDAVHRHLLHGRADVLQQHPHGGGRHAPDGLPPRAHLHDQQVRRRQQAHQGEGKALRRRHARGPDRGREREGAPAAVRGPDEDEARQRRGGWHRGGYRRRQAAHLLRGEPRRREGDHREDAARLPRPRGGAPGPREHAPQGRDGRPFPAGQAARLLQPRRLQDRTLPRGGRFRRRFRPDRTRPFDPGDPAPARQGAERREGARRPHAREQRDPHAHHGHRLRLRGGMGHLEGPLPQDRHHDRCRRGRRPHPHAPADVLLPQDARTHRARLRLPRPAAALQGGAQEEERVRADGRRDERAHPLPRPRRHDRAARERRGARQGGGAPAAGTPGRDQGDGGDHCAARPLREGAAGPP